MGICILITNEYPYGVAETFIENEIVFLSEAFDKVIVFAVNAQKDDVPTRKIPSNCSSYQIGAKKTKIRYPYYCVKGLYEGNDQLHIEKYSLSKRVISLYAIGRSNFVFDRIKEIILSFNLINSTNTVTVYSYWFTDQSIVAWRIKDYLQSFGIIVKAVSRAHGYDLYWERHAIKFLPFQEESLSNLDGVFPCSLNGTDYLLDKYKKYENKIKTAYLGTIDYGTISASIDNKTIMTCCYFDPVKRMMLFAQAFVEACKIIPNMHWICIGNGVEFDEVKEYVINNGFERNVSFLGPLKNSEVIEVYLKNKISYFCNVSISEGLPVSIMEAISFGIPIIATNAGGTKELIRKNGFLIDVNTSVNNLKNVFIDSMNMDAELYDNMSKESRKLWEEKFNAKTNYHSWSEELTI